MNTRAIFHKGEKLIELRDDHSWNVVDDLIIVTNSNDPDYGFEILVPDGDAEGLVEVFLGAA